MRTLGGYLKRYYQDELQPYGRAYLLPVLFICALTAAEYSFHLDKYLFDTKRAFWLQLSSQWIYLLLIWTLPLWWIGRRRQTPLNWKLWYPWLLLGLLVYAFRSTYKGHFERLSDISLGWDRNTYYFYWFTVAQWFQALSVALPLVLIGWFSRRQLDAFHGLKRAKVQPYFILLLGAAVVVALASTQADFQDYYPRFAKMWPDGGERQWSRILAFEASYALDFFATEYLFRGFLVLAFARYLGPSAILPMAILYVTIHYGKPLGETISSFFGGMLLGVFAYYSKSIWGGIILHIGLAWLMELIVLL
ncbi:MAG: CPBP family intramembrane metalloprotease [Sphingobacteriaceae bacterium]|nr:CPBP family intramembrane metalloprotease [Sphingobacteriaceae bacterium]